MDKGEYIEALKRAAEAAGKQSGLFMAKSSPEIRVTECLWAKTFRDAKAGDIGYATICYQDYAMSQGFSSKLKMIRSKTLMQGHDYCNHRWVWEG